MDTPEIWYTTYRSFLLLKIGDLHSLSSITELNTRKNVKATLRKETLYKVQLKKSSKHSYISFSLCKEGNQVLYHMALYEFMQGLKR